MTPEIIYIPTLISEPPKEDGYYQMIDEDGDPSDPLYFMEGDWFVDEEDARVNENHDALDANGYSWLKPTPIAVILEAERKDLDIANKTVDRLIKQRNQLKEELVEVGKLAEAEKIKIAEEAWEAGKVACKSATTVNWTDWDKVELEFDDKEIDSDKATYLSNVLNNKK
jgi:hypothetical protein